MDCFRNDMRKVGIALMQFAFDIPLDPNIAEPLAAPNPLVELRNMWHETELAMGEYRAPFDESRNAADVIRRERDRIKWELEQVNKRYDSALRDSFELGKPIAELVKVRSEIMDAIKEANGGSVNVEDWVKQ